MRVKDGLMLLGKRATLAYIQLSILSFAEISLTSMSLIHFQWLNATGPQASNSIVLFCLRIACDLSQCVVTCTPVAVGC